MTTTTAEELITDSLDRAQKCLAKILDPAAGKVDYTAVISLIGNFNTAVLLEALRRHDPAEADRITQWLKDVHEAGDTTGEMVHQWREQLASGHHMTGIGGHRPQPPAPKDTEPFQLWVDEGFHTAAAVDTGVPGLRAVQALSYADTDGALEPCPGEWLIAHKATGRALTRWRFPLDIARQAIDRLGNLGVDWTEQIDDLKHVLNQDTRHVIEGIFAQFGNCRHCSDADHLPVAPWRTTPIPATAGSEQ